MNIPVKLPLSQLSGAGSHIWQRFGGGKVLGCAGLGCLLPVSCVGLFMIVGAWGFVPTDVWAGSDSAPVQENITISRGDAYLYTANDKDYEGCTYADDVGLAFCKRFLQVIAQRHRSGYYEQNAPAGWCNAADCNQVSENGQLVKTSD